MTAKLIVTTATVAALSATVGAQPGTATYSIAFGSPTGPNTAVLQPGETVHAFANVAYNPGIGGNIWGLSDGAFSISSSGSGSGSWAVDAVTASPTYSLPQPWGGQSVGGLGVSVGIPSESGVTGVVWGYGFLFGPPHPYPQNPANVFRCTFTATTPGEIAVTFAKLETTGVFFRQWAVLSYQSVPGAGGTVTIVPAPAGIALLAISGALASRRRQGHGGQTRQAYAARNVE